jgi:hypothetical protein
MLRLQAYRFELLTPSEATATLDIRALPHEDMPAFYDLMRKGNRGSAGRSSAECRQAAAGGRAHQHHVGHLQSD